MFTLFTRSSVFTETRWGGRVEITKKTNDIDQVRNYWHTWNDLPLHDIFCVVFCWCHIYHIVMFTGCDGPWCSCQSFVFTSVWLPCQGSCLFIYLLVSGSTSQFSVHIYSHLGSRSTGWNLNYFVNCKFFLFSGKWQVFFSVNPDFFSCRESRAIYRIETKGQKAFQAASSLHQLRGTSLLVRPKDTFLYKQKCRSFRLKSN